MGSRARQKHERKLACAAFGDEAKAAVIARQDGACFFCDLALGERHVFDHLVPRTQGGADTEENRVAAHIPCDALKRDRMPTEAELAKLAAQRAR